MEARPDILCFSSTDWDGLWGSRQQVMLRFARRGYRVLFVEQLAGLEHLWRYPELRQRKLRRRQEGLRQVNENLWIINPPPLLPGRYYLDWVNRLNCAWVQQWIQPVLKKLQIKQPVLWVYKPEHAGLLAFFDPCLRVYHCIDEWTAGVRGLRRRNITRLEINLLQQVDLVFANSRLTYERKRQFHPHILRIPSGADIAHFSQALDPAFPEHPALSAIPHPRLGYSGTINERLDYAFLETLASQEPGLSLVFAGDPYPWTFQAPPLRRLRCYPNVHFLGPLPFTQMPAFLKGLDACLIPYVNDERGRFRSPLKLFEYLASGKPVISAPHPEIEPLPGIIYIGATPADFALQAVIALQEDTPLLQQQRLAFAQPHSWDRRVDEMEGALLNRR